MSSLGRNRLRIDRGETDMLALQNFFFFFNHHWCYLDNNRVIPHVLTRNHVWQVKLLPHREFLAASDGHIFFVMKDISLAPLRSSALLVPEPSSLTSVTDWICFSCSIYHTGDLYISSRTGFVLPIRKHGWSRCERCRGHTAQNAHQAFLLITVKCVLRMQTGRRCMSALISQHF